MWSIQREKMIFERNRMGFHMKRVVSERDGMGSTKNKLISVEWDWMGFNMKNRWYLNVIECDSTWKRFDIWTWLHIKKRWHPLMNALLSRFPLLTVFKQYTYPSGRKYKIHLVLSSKPKRVLYFRSQRCCVSDPNVQTKIRLFSGWTVASWAGR